MADPTSSPVYPPATDADGKLVLSSEEARALLRECFAQFRSAMIDMLHTSIETTNDLFETNPHVNDADVVDFRSRRGEWVKGFDAAIQELFEKRLAGEHRHGRRPDADRSLASLRVLNAFDQEKQLALTHAARFLYRLAKRELDALDLRVGALLGEALTRDIDNPLGPDYILDAIGMTSRALFPNPRVWRPLMERLLADMTPGITKIDIRLNRFLADRGVLPEIKAQLRARSELRPADDSELLSLFNRLIKETAPPDIATTIEVPPASTIASPAAPFAFDADRPAATTSAAVAPAMPAAIPPPQAPGPAQASGTLANPYLAVLPQAAPAQHAQVSGDAFAFPQLNPLLALGPLSAIVSALDHWQHFDPLLQGQPSTAPVGVDATVMPLNRVPWIRAAIAHKIVNPTDKITIDVIGLLFDYIFRDPSIPASLRSVFSRLQVPILKAALLDRTFFSDKKHPARRLLDHLAAAAIGATSDDGYRAGFELVATGVVDEVCHAFQVDVAAFDSADVKLQEFVEAEQRRTATSLDKDIAAAIIAEETEADRARVRALIRDKLAGLDLPFDVRAFTETIWADHLTSIRKQDGAESEAWRHAAYTLDDLLWSITAKDRTAQKARLSKMIPSLVRSLRSGCAALQVRDERSQPFFETLYHLHIAALKPAASAGARAAAAARAGEVSATVAQAAATVDKPLGAVANVHDFVSEMVPGTWLAFKNDGDAINARLFWISPLRTQYIFTSRSRGKAFVFTPEELAWELGAGKARLVVEPVPLFDRAVSAALDSLAAKKAEAATASSAFYGSPSEPLSSASG